MKWELLQESAEQMGKLGDPERARRDMYTISTWVRELAPWDTFATLTFRREGVSVMGAAKSTERFFRKVQRGVPLVYYVEPNPTRGDGGHHVHAMLATSGGLHRGHAWERWFNLYGVCKVEPIANGDAVATYVSKLAPYVTKSAMKGGLWWNVLNCEQGAL